MRILILLTLVSLSCKSKINLPEKMDEHKMHTSIESSSEKEPILETDKDVINTVSKMEEESLESPEFNYEAAYDSLKTNISLFSLGSFGEGDEMPTEFREKSWLGLYLSDSLAYLKPVSLSFEVEEMQDCGDDVLVRLVHEGPIPYFLISGLNANESGVPYAKSDVYEVLEYDHLSNPEIMYSFSWGPTRKISEYLEEFESVLWSVSRKSESDTLTQILFKTESIPLDNHLNIDFMGDLDQDGISDLIIDVSTGYSYSINVLFLSSFAEDGEILHPVAVFRTWAC
ncbi:MAG: hypothetical protein RLZZ241_253 [Bacteroidota bacterium]